MTGLRRGPNSYVSRRALITDMTAFRRLGIIAGHSTDDQLIMRVVDWHRALAAGCVQVLDHPVPSPINAFDTATG